MKPKNVVVIGGGTGTFTVLMGLKAYLGKNINLSVILTMMDSGGSNRIIRDEFGLLPTSDIRQAIVALSDEKPSDVLRKLFTYRYSQGTGITGMTFGNLFMAALTDIYGSQEIAIKKTCEFLDVRGQIIPVTYDNTNLVAKYDDGKQVLGEHFIDEPTEKNIGKKIVELSTFPPANASKDAILAIKNADFIILGPGDLYTSILSNIVVNGIGKKIARSKAKKIFIMNLMTRQGQTEGFKASDHLNELYKYMEPKCIDYCLVNNDFGYPKNALSWYRRVNTFPVELDIKSDENLKVIKGSFFDRTIQKKAKGDKLIRSLIRHHPNKLAKALVKIIR